VVGFIGELLPPLHLVFTGYCVNILSQIVVFSLLFGCPRCLFLLLGILGEDILQHRLEHAA
jgi:hypothetical protein